jgi:hypothetical protein
VASLSTVRSARSLAAAASIRSGRTGCEVLSFFPAQNREVGRRIPMRKITNLPLLVFFLSLAVLWLAAEIGAHLRGRLRLQEEDHHKDFDIVLAAALTLLGLVIGFSFSMVITHYDQRKNYEEGEANAIGTEYLRAKLLPDAEGVKVRDLLNNYLDERILFYQTSSEEELERINNRTKLLQDALWTSVEATAEKQQTPTLALVVSE